MVPQYKKKLKKYDKFNLELHESLIPMYYKLRIQHSMKKKLDPLIL